MSATPWARYRTAQPESFTCWLERGVYYMGVGNDPDSSPSLRLHFQSFQLLLLPSQAKEPQPVAAFRLHLPFWTGSGVPYVQLHPLAMFHLLATEQVPRSDIAQGMKTVGRSSAFYYSCPLTMECDILGMLRVDRAVLAFATNFDLRVTDTQR